MERQLDPARRAPARTPHPARPGHRRALRPPHRGRHRRPCRRPRRPRRRRVLRPGSGHGARLSGQRSTTAPRCPPTSSSSPPASGPRSASPATPGSRSGAASWSTTTCGPPPRARLGRGECAEHRGVVYGPWAPVLEQAPRGRCGEIAGRPNAFHGAVPATTLKVAGIDLFCAGAAAEPDALAEEVIALDSRRERYRKLVLRDGALAGATLLGDVGEARKLRSLIASGEAGAGGAARDRLAHHRRARRPPHLLVPGGLARRDRDGDQDARAEDRRAGLRVHRGGHRLWRLPPRSKRC